MNSGMELSPRAQRIKELCGRCGEIYLHKPSGVRYRVAHTLDDNHELHPISGPCRYANDDHLANANIWEKQP